MDIGKPDLNLLKVLDALLKDRSVTKAAERLNLSQPAMSHALNRLREQLNDPLMMRSFHGMDPTPYAESLTDLSPPPTRKRAPRAPPASRRRCAGRCRGAC